MYILLTGVLHKDPTQRTSANGKEFVTCNVRAEQDGETTWASVICFDEQARAELLRCHAGDVVAIQGKLKVSVYERNGEHKPSLDVVANTVMPAKPKPRPKAAQRQQRRQGDVSGHKALYGRAEHGFDDPITF